MKVKHETTLRRATKTGAAASSARAADDWAAPQIVADVLKRLPEGSARCVASAPGRLDVMGGIAEYTGALVLHMPLARRVCVAVQQRSDGIISVVQVPGSQADSDGAIEVSCQQLFGSDGTSVDADRRQELARNAPDETVRCVLGVLVEALRAGIVSDFSAGCSIVVGSDLDGLTDAGRNAAVAAAVLVATTRSMGVTVEPLQAVALCQRVENDWLGAAVGAADAGSALLGEPHALTQIQCDPCTLADPIRLPDEITLAGVDSGVVSPHARNKYELARTAAFMGRALIDRILRYDGADPAGWDGHLARLSVTDYVERLRDRIPTKLKGDEFLQRFGETGDPLTRIDPEYVYKIRSRTEHHIYEHARSRRFVECLSRAVRDGDRTVLYEAGELMYASHWSYGQRCGLGSVETDLLVNLIRRHGAEAGICGAKISGRGCGGVVAVLMQATRRAQAAIDAAIEAYCDRTARRAVLIQGSSPGALVTSRRR